MPRHGTIHSQRPKDDLEDCPVCDPGNCPWRKAQAESPTPECSLCHPEPCIMKKIMAKNVEIEKDCNICDTQPCVLKKTSSQPGDCSLCSPGPCVITKPQVKQSGEQSDCKVCDPKPCVLKSMDRKQCQETTTDSSKFAPMKLIGRAKDSSKLIGRAKDSSKESECSVCAPNPCSVKKKKEDDLPECHHCAPHPCIMKTQKKCSSSVSTSVPFRFMKSVA